MDAGRLARPTRQPAVMPPASVLTTNIGSFSQPHWLLECFHPQPLSLSVQTGIAMRDRGAQACTREGRSARACEQLLKSLLHAFGIPERVR
jgi:hypothetical protein